MHSKTCCLCSPRGLTQLHPRWCRRWLTTSEDLSRGWWSKGFGKKGRWKSRHCGEDCGTSMLVRGDIAPHALASTTSFLCGSRTSIQPPSFRNLSITRLGKFERRSIPVTVSHGPTSSKLTKSGDFTPRRLLVISIRRSLSMLR